ncbi:hypothetical protein [Kitasatospora sp. NPDC056800]
MNDVLRRFGPDEDFAADVAPARAMSAEFTDFADEVAMAAVSAAEPLST